MYDVVEVKSNRERFLPLLLEADPSRNMVGKYISRGSMYIVKQEQKVLAVAIVVRLSGTVCEIKNIAVCKSLRRQGYGTMLLKHIFSESKKKGYTQIYVGTSESGVPFYEKLGFTHSHVEKGFFTDYYPEPIYENGVQCVDMLYLRRAL